MAKTRPVIRHLHRLSDCIPLQSPLQLPQPSKRGKFATFLISIKNKFKLTKKKMAEDMEALVEREASLIESILTSIPDTMDGRRESEEDCYNPYSLWT
jgi:hypothetical protein